MEHRVIDNEDIIDDYVVMMRKEDCTLRDCKRSRGAPRHARLVATISLHLPIGKYLTYFTYLTYYLKYYQSLRLVMLYSVCTSVAVLGFFSFLSIWKKCHIKTDQVPRGMSPNGSYHTIAATSQKKLHSCNHDMCTVPFDVLCTR